MSQLLSKEQICALYRAKNYEDLVVFGRSIKHKVPGVKRRKFTLDDYGTPEFEAYHDRLLKTPGNSAARVIEPDVTEQIF